MTSLNTQHLPTFFNAEKKYCFALIFQNEVGKYMEIVWEMLRNTVGQLPSNYQLIVLTCTQLILVIRFTFFSSFFKFFFLQEMC